MTGRIGHIDIALSVHRDPARAIELNQRAQTILVAGLAVARQGADKSLGIDPTDPMVARIGDDHAAIRT